MHIHHEQVIFWWAAMAEWLCCLVRTTRHRMTLDKSLTAVCLGPPGRCILITCGIYRPLWLVSVYGELKWLSGGTLRQAGLLPRATANNNYRKNIGLSKLSPDSRARRVQDFRTRTRRALPDSTLYRKVDERRGILSFNISMNETSLKMMHNSFDQH
jgi:hypothetical protein